ncbi:integral membrane protein DUF6 containing protein (macronuclear) [Tetrahymena thermophila SB210]|uniref:Integral membrane protein DUF6 containing protein n=1 Tax=Tetrahymena thermophila (strain SB210) TaxID=312017 RepID=W7X0A8_TETTS|nr:integral membrane protein DUF6 containing protein [Tetrahymena thermophila SB210]EWS72540.1 integral membrane protein DUF6 containing protein [Tetrahymena thermophila SB210]|eukprot:XP_012654920.1 integral membrane protein DUF6 containing protein [Tetrahymena thermophila SB210]
MCWILKVGIFHIIPVYPKNITELKLMVSRGLLGGITAIIMFQSFKYLNISDAVVFGNTNPIWTSFLAAIFLGEKLTIKSLIFSFISFLGMLLIIKPDFFFEATLDKEPINMQGRNQVKGCMFALFGSILLSFIQIILSKVQKQMKCNNAQLLMYNHFFGCIITGITELQLPNNDIIVNKRFLFIILIMGVLAFISQLLFTRSFTLEKASIISPLQYIGVVLSFLVDIFFFNEQIYLTSVLGAVLIIVGSIAIIL